MPVTVIIGGQFGGEGKGKVAHFLAREMGAKIAVRVGGTNSGHTVIDPFGNPIILRQLPTPAILPNTTCVFGAGSYIDVDILYDEIKRTGLSRDKLFIDPNAIIITENDLNSERSSSLRSSINSTLSGTGAAVLRRISRDGSANFAKDDERIKQFIQPVVPLMRDLLSAGERIVIEGTQGFGLSVLHTPYYPYATSRDTTAAAFVSEAGLSPLDVDDIVMVIRAFPIRVGGNSGPLPKEIDWATITAESNNDPEIVEHTSVTKTIRRVARFDPAIVHAAIMTNQPSRIVLNHLDYVDSQGAILNKYTDKLEAFVDKIQFMIKRKIDYLGFGPGKITSRKEPKRKVMSE
jgi:adenylosuccinate synthase